jgi:uncharacterized cupredoxin-like copper-binding protein
MRVRSTIAALATAGALALSIGVVAAVGAQASSAKTPVLRVDASPAGKLAFVQKKISVKAGAITFVLHNKSAVPHNLGVKGNGLDDEQIGAPSKTITKSVTKVTYKLTPGTYEFYCEVPGHEAAGMKGKLVVK